MSIRRIFIYNFSILMTRIHDETIKYLLQSSSGLHTIELI